MKIFDIDKEKSRLAALCARSEVCTSEVKMKLRRTRLSDEERKEILDFLVSNNFVNDERYAAAFAHDKATFTCYGPVKIQHELRKRAIPPEFVEKAIDAVPEDVFLANARKFVKTRVEALSAKDFDRIKIHDKVYHYLVGRGFTHAQIHKVIPPRSAAEYDADDF